ncbi:hypothetical protein N9B17_07895 [Rhodopirellula sp.]|nr:hypothetical protein [Rhodopirellula sp.]
MPPVMTGVGSNAEHVTHGIEGFLAPRSGSQTFGKRLLVLLRSRDQCNAVGAATRKRAESDFDLAGVIKEHAAHFQKMARC